MHSIVLIIALAGTAAHGASTQVRAAGVEGTVRDTTGRPLSDVQVWIVPTDLKTRSDSSGHYRLDSVPAGSAIVRTGIIGYVSAQQTVVLSAGERVTLNFSVLPRNLPDGGNTVITVPMGQADSQ